MMTIPKTEKETDRINMPVYPYPAALVFLGLALSHEFFYVLPTDISILSDREKKRLLCDL